ncbi:MAG: flippase-like domain-containing protein [Acidobacteria bacterium]|nr:flippase-like domain-containing protein [Acidobacteriota bacterium]
MRRKIESAVILLAGAALAVWFIRSLEWQAVMGHLRSMMIWPIALAGCLILLTLVMRSWRWSVLLLPISRVGFGDLFAATTIGFGSVFIFGRAGEVVRPVVLSMRKRIAPSATIATILVERVFDMSAVALLFAVNLVFFTPPPGSLLDAQTMERLNWFGAAATGVTALGVAALIVFRLRSAWVIGVIERLGRWAPARLLDAVLSLVANLSAGLSVLLNLRELASVLVLTLAVWALVAASTWLVVLAFGITLSLGASVFILGFGLVGSLIPSPGGAAGAFHAAAAAGLILLGIDRNLSAGISIVLHLVAFGSPFLLGLFFLARDGIGLRELREMISSRKGSQPQPGYGDQSTGAGTE